MNLSRRLFLKHGSITFAALGACAAPSFLTRAAQAAEDAKPGQRRKVLICVFQRGAADGLSMVAPFGDKFYYQHRSEIAIARPSKTDEKSAIDLDGYFGLAPTMKAFEPLYRSGQLAVIHACGSPSSSRSHFDMQDFMESGVVDNKSIESGWLGRMLTERDKAAAANAAIVANAAKRTPFRAVAMGSTVPRTLHGEAEALAIRDLATFGVTGSGTAGAAGVAAGFEGMYEKAVGDVLQGTGKESFEAIALLKKADPTKYKPAKGVEYPANPFGRGLLQVAQLIKADVGLEVAFVESDGWDTHANQGGPFGQLAGRLYDFSRGIAALHQDLGDRMADAMILTMSEFGRAVRQNGNRGTDHGHGTAFFALGGPVKGGRVYGDWPTLAPEKLFEQRDLEVTTDYRDVFAEICARHLGVPVGSLPKVFPSHKVDERKFRGVCKA